MKTCLITGITGQDGSYLAEFLLEKGYDVHGIIRKSSSINTFRIDHIYNNKNLHLHYGDLTDSLSIDSVISKVKPNEVFHLGAQSHVHVSFQIPKYTGEVDALGTLYLLESIRKHCPNTKIYNATTSELFGKIQDPIQNEETAFYPRSPYGIAKLYSFWMVKNYRESYGLFGVNGILFNHESERRGETFVTRKITLGFAKYIKNGTPFYLGNLEAKRDWGYAPDYIEGMWMMLQQDKPEDFVLATGETHSIKEFIDECLQHLNIVFDWIKDDKGRDILWDRLSNKLIIGIDEKYYRPAEVELLLGDASKAKRILGWEPKTTFNELVTKMIKHDTK